MHPSSMVVVVQDRLNTRYLSDAELKQEDGLAKLTVDHMRANWSALIGGVRLQEMGREAPLIT
eukprot:3614749-Alexandrium_andersonii.AAC.1